MLCQFDFSQRSARRTPSKASLIDCILTINIWKSFGWCKKFCVYEHWKHNRADTNKEEITPWVIISFIFITWLLKIIWTLSITEDRNVLCRNKFEYDQNNHVSYCISQSNCSFEEWSDCRSEFHLTWATLAHLPRNSHVMQWCAKGINNWWMTRLA